MKEENLKIFGLTGWALNCLAVLLFCLGIVGGYKLNWAVGAGMYVLLVGAILCALGSAIFKPKNKGDEKVIKLE